MISNSGHDERGQYSGGAAGDQGGEWAIINWYQYPWDGGWHCVLRYPNQQARQLLAELAIQAANNDNIGYNQNQRYSYWTQLQNAGFFPANITVPCDSDCSAGVIANTRAVGYLLNINPLKNINASYTGNMRAGYAAAGFQVLTDGKYLTSNAYLMPGDILLNDIDHTCVNLGIGSKSGYSPSGSGGGAADEGASEYNNSRLTTKEIQTILKAVGWPNLAVDGSYGPKTIATVKEFQTLYGLQADGITGPATTQVLDTVYAYLKTLGFDAEYYANKYPDVKKAYGNNLRLLLCHYYKYGRAEGREIKQGEKKATSNQVKKEVASTPIENKNELTLNTTGKYDSTPKKYGVVTTNLLNVRQGPGTDYRNITSYPLLSYGNEVDICDKVKGSDGDAWYYIRIAGKHYGFVHSNWVQVS